MRFAVCLAAMMPASLAVSSGSPLASAPERTSFSAAGLILMSPVATASRLLTGLSPTSTIFARPRASTCERRRGLRGAVIGVSLREIEGQALQRDREVDALQLHVGWHPVERARGEVQDGLDAGGDDLIDHWLGVRRRHRDHRNIQALTPSNFLQILDIEDRHPTPRLAADLLVRRIEERRNLEPFLPEAWIVGERESQIAGAHDRHAQAPIETQDLAQVAA